MPSTAGLEVDATAFKAAAMLVGMGVQATSVAGGTSAWRLAGHRVVLGQSEA